MKKITLILLVFFHLFTNAQVKIQLNLKGVANKKLSSTIPAGTQLSIIEITDNIDPYFDVSQKGAGYPAKTATLYCNDLSESISVSQLDQITVTPSNIREFWTNQALKHSVYKNLLTKGFQYDLRKDIEEDAIEYLKLIQHNNLSYEDSYLESYLYSLAYKIYPVSIADGRPGILNIKILIDNTPRAFIFTNGTLVLSTGLLSTIHSEEELVGVMAHEIAHFVLDHSVVNINKAIQRKQTAEFWAGFATVAAAATEGYFMSKNAHYKPGALTVNTAILSQSISNIIIDRLGLSYTKEQEMEADRCAIELMKFISVSPLALSSALMKIKDNRILNGDYSVLSGAGTHPAIDLRINQIGQPGKYYDINYDRRISFVNTLNAIVEHENQRFVSSLTLAQRNIDSNVAIEDDFLLAAIATMNMFDSEEKNREALELIYKAKTINILPTSFITKQEAICLIKLKRLAEAKLCLQKYKEELDADVQNNNKFMVTQQWSSTNDYLKKEYEWTVKMISKVDKL